VQVHLHQFQEQVVQVVAEQVQQTQGFHLLHLQLQELLTQVVVAAEQLTILMMLQAQAVAEQLSSHTLAHKYF
jgi:hypothetical protein